MPNAKFGHRIARDDEEMFAHTWCPSSFGAAIMAQNIVGLEVRKQESGRYIYVLSLDKLNRQLGAIFLTRNFFISFFIIFAQN